MEGWLHKEGHFIRNWKKRWCVLQQEEGSKDKYRFVYYSDQTRLYLRGEIPIRENTEVKYDDSKSKPSGLSQSYFFQIRTGSHYLRVGAESKDEMQAWMSMINKVRHLTEPPSVENLKINAPPKANLSNATPTKLPNADKPVKMNNPMVPLVVSPTHFYQRALLITNTIINAWENGKKAAFLSCIDESMFTAEIIDSHVFHNFQDLWTFREKMNDKLSPHLVSSHTLSQETKKITVYVTLLDIKGGKSSGLKQFIFQFNDNWQKIIYQKMENIYENPDQRGNDFKILKNPVPIQERMMAISNLMIYSWKNFDEKNYKKCVSNDLRLIIYRLDLDISGVENIWNVRKKLSNLSPYLLSSHTFDLMNNQMKAWQQRVDLSTGKIEFLDEVTFTFDSAYRTVIQYEQKSLFVRQNNAGNTGTNQPKSLEDTEE